MDYSDEQRKAARAELARRELAKRGQPLESSLEMEEDDNSSHPFLRMLTGLVHAGRNVHNLPHNEVKSLEDIFSGLGKNFEGIIGPKFSEHSGEHKPLSSRLPYDPNTYEDIFGLKGEGNLIDKLIQGGAEHSPEIISGIGMARGAVKRLKGTHYLNELEKIIKEKGLNDFNYHPNTIKEARNYLPKSHATNEMIKDVEQGKYGSAFNMQSQVGKHQRDLAKSPLAAERLLAPRAGELKQNMLNELGNILRSNGLHKEADILSKGIKNYAQYTKVKNAAMPIIKYLGIPTTILTALGFGYKKMKND